MHKPSPVPVAVKPLALACRLRQAAKACPRHPPALSHSRSCLKCWAEVLIKRPTMHYRVHQTRKFPDLLCCTHRLVQLSQLRRGPSMILDERPLNWLPEVFLRATSNELPIELVTRHCNACTCDKSRHQMRTCLTLKLSVKILCASLNSGVENDRRGSSFLRISSSCTSQRNYSNNVDINHRQVSVSNECRCLRWWASPSSHGPASLRGEPVVLYRSDSLFFHTQPVGRMHQKLT